MNKIAILLLTALFLSSCGEDKAPSNENSSYRPPVPQNTQATTSQGQTTGASKPDAQYKESGYGMEGIESNLKFKRVIHDFGTVKKGKVVEVEYEYKNLTTHSVEIQQLLTSCDCMSGEYKKEPIHPGEAGVIKGKFDTKNQNPARYEKIFTLVIKGQDHPVALLLKGTVIE